MRRWLRSMRMLWRLQKMMLGMPGSQASASAYFGRTLSAMQQLVRAGAQSQQFTITDGSGAPVINFGVTPGSNPPIYGMQFLNPATGLPVMFLGVDASGAPGLHVYNATGTEQVRLGELATSPALYGLGVLPYGGTELQQVGGVIYDEVDATITYTSDSPSPAANGGPTLSALIGPSGSALVFSSATVNLVEGADSSTSLATWIMIDTIHGGPVATLSFSASVTPSSTTLQTDLEQTLTASGVVTGLTPGVHTFELWYTFGPTTGTGAGQFSDRVLTVQPL